MRSLNNDLYPSFEFHGRFPVRSFLFLIQCLSLNVVPIIKKLKEYFSIDKGSFKNHVDTIFLFSDHPPTLMDIFYVLNVDKMANFRPPTNPLLCIWFLNGPHAVLGVSEAKRTRLKTEL